MSAKKAAVDFATIVSKVPPEARAAIAKIRGQHGALSEKLRVLPEAPPALDWAKYRSAISTPGVVEGAEKAYKAFSYPKGSDTKTAELEKTFASQQTEAAKIVEAANARIAELKGQLKAAENAPSLTEVTLEDLQEKHPQKHAEYKDKVYNYDYPPTGF